MNTKQLVGRACIHSFYSCLFAFLLTACGGGGEELGTGTVGVSLTDAPACGYDAVYVTVRQVRIHRSSGASETGGGWSDITLNPPRKINLLDLNNGVLEGLGETSVPAGRYNQVRLVLVSNTGGSPANSVILSGTVNEIPIDTPSAVQSGIKLVHGFTVQPGQRTDLVLDFDACKSIVTRGNNSYALKPVIHVVPAVLNGIEGAVDPTLLASNVVISAQQSGEVIRSTVPRAGGGTFFLGRLEAGTYDVVVTADGRVTTVIRSVPIANENFVAVVGTVAQPITLAPATPHTVSGTVVLNPLPATETVAYVTAKQSVDGPLTITVRSTAADLVNGSYSMTLPANAPLIGAYGTGALPISVGPASTGGQYAIQATAEGYATQVVNKDLSTADATQNFTLIH